LIIKRRKNAKDYAGRLDLVSVLLENEAFSKETETIIDEMLNFIIAGTDTMVITTQNMLQLLSKP